MLDKDTLLAVLEQFQKLQQEQPEASITLYVQTLNQMLDRATDRWNDGFRAGLDA